MTTREKILLGATAAAAIAGAIYYVLPQAGAKKGSAGSKPTDFSALIAQVQVSLKQGALTDREEHILEAAVTQRVRDPFRSRPLVSSSNTAGIPLPKYTGFINTGPKPIAIIDGRDYRPDEPVLGGEFQVVKIYPDRVELLRRGASDPVRVPFEKTQGQAGPR